MFSFGTWERQQNFAIGLVATNTSQALLQCSLDLIFDFFCNIKSRFALSVICKGLRKKNGKNTRRTHKKKTTGGSCCLTQLWDIRKLYVFLKPIDRRMLTLENLQLGVVQLHIGIRWGCIQKSKYQAVRFLGTKNEGPTWWFWRLSR